MTTLGGIRITSLNAIHRTLRDGWRRGLVRDADVFAEQEAAGLVVELFVGRISQRPSERNGQASFPAPLKGAPRGVM